jgi:hypothetical protein
MSTDGYSCSFHFARKKLARNDITCEKTLQVEDFSIAEVEEFFRPCAIDPGVTTLITAAYGTGSDSHEVRSFSNKEYYALTGSKRRNADMNKKKTSCGIATIESKMPSPKTVNLSEYQAYLNYFFENSQALRNFYNFETADTSFKHYQGRQRAIEETANILINGGRKYDKKRRKKQDRRSKRQKHRTRSLKRKNNRLKKEAKRKQRNDR